MQLDLIKTKGNMFGQMIVAYWAIDPEETRRTIADQYKDNPRMVEETVGLINLKELEIV